MYFRQKNMCLQSCSFQGGFKGVIYTDVIVVGLLVVVVKVSVDIISLIFKYYYFIIEQSRLNFPDIFNSMRITDSPSLTSPSLSIEWNAVLTVACC